MRNGWRKKNRLISADKSHGCTLYMSVLCIGMMAIFPLWIWLVAGQHWCGREVDVCSMFNDFNAIRPHGALRRNVSSSTLGQRSLSPIRALRMLTTRRLVSLCSRWWLDGIYREHSCTLVRVSPMSNCCLIRGSISREREKDREIVSIHFVRLLTPITLTISSSLVCPSSCSCGAPGARGASPKSIVNITVFGAMLPFSFLKQYLKVEANRI